MAHALAERPRVVLERADLRGHRAPLPSHLCRGHRCALPTVLDAQGWPTPLTRLGVGQAGVRGWPTDPQSIPLDGADALPANVHVERAPGSAISAGLRP